MNEKFSARSAVFSALVIFFLAAACGTPALAEQFPAVVEAEERAVLAAEREGVLSDLRVGAGDSVKKGQLLGGVFHRDLILQKELRLATREYLEIQVENLVKLSGRGMVTDEELAKAKMDLAVNGKEISLVENQIERSSLRAPFSGVVVTRHIEPHEWVQPGQPVVELYNPRELRIVADLPADLAFRLKEGQEHRFMFPDVQGEVAGRLNIFSPQVDVRSNTIKIFWTVPRGGGVPKLLPGMKGVLQLGDE